MTLTNIWEFNKKVLEKYSESTGKEPKSTGKVMRKYSESTGKVLREYRKRTGKGPGK